VGPHYFVHYKGWKQTCAFPHSDLAQDSLHGIDGTSGFPQSGFSSSTRPISRCKRSYQLQHKRLLQQQRPRPLRRRKARLAQPLAEEKRGKVAQERNPEDINGVEMRSVFFPRHSVAGFADCLVYRPSLSACYGTLHATVPVFTIPLAPRKDESNRKPELKLIVPDVLKMILVDDWEAVTKNHQVSLFVISELLILMTMSWHLCPLHNSIHALHASILTLKACHFSTNTKRSRAATRI
jgi:MRG